MKYFITYVNDIRTILLNKKWKNGKDKKCDHDLIWMLYKDIDFLKTALIPVKLIKLPSIFKIYKYK